MVKPSTSEPSPLSPKRWPADAFAWPRSLVALLIVLAAFALGIAAASLLIVILARAAHTVPTKTTTLTWGIALGQYISYLPILAALIVVLPRLARRSLRDLGWTPPTGAVIRAGVVGAIAMYAVTIGVAGIQFAITHAKPEETAIQLFGSTKDPALLASFVVLAAFAAPLMEEFEFRGFLFNAFLRYLPVWAAALASGILFGLSHASPTAFFPLAASGVVLAYVYYKSGSLTASAITHALFNLINVALLSLGKT